MNEKKKIIYVMPSLASFTRSDIAILSKKKELVINVYDWTKKHFVLFYMIHQFFFLLYHIPHSQYILISFGGYWAFFPTLLGKIFGKKTYIILNGTDCAAIPSVNYGSLRGFLLRNICHLSYKMASCLLPVSDSLISTQNTYYSDDSSSFQGYQHFFPSLKNKPYQIVHNGIDTVFWQRLEKNIPKEEKSFIAVFSSSQFVLKGGDLIVKLAENLPDCTFYLAGLDQPKQLKKVSDNVIFLGKLSPEKLRFYYNKAQFHFQLSIFEGFGCALCEAMLCGCIPIVSSVNILPKIIGKSGFILEKRDLNELEKLVKKALMVKNKQALEIKARQQVVDNYSLEKRSKNLLELS